MINSSYTVIFYETTTNKCPTDEFLDSLQPKIRAKIAKWIEKLEEHGPNLPRPYADVLIDKIRELRIVFGSNHYRLLYFFFGKIIVITHGFIKKNDQVPQLELKTAQRYMQDFLLHNQGAN